MCLVMGKPGGRSSSCIVLVGGSGWARLEEEARRGRDESFSGEGGVVGLVVLGGVSA